MALASILRRVKVKGGGTATVSEQERLETSRQPTVPETNIRQDTELGLPIGRQGNDHLTPDNPRGAFVIEHDTGKRQQDFANTHLSEGPKPGRIPRFWNKRLGGILGRNITGNPSGDDAFGLEITGIPDGGFGDAKYIQHLQIPRGTVVARAFARTVDDAASIPAVYVSDPTRH